MNKIGILDQVKELLTALSGKSRFDKGDFVLLKTALMLAAVDGEVGEDEVDLFKELAGTCRGYSGEAFETLWECAVRSAGYLLLQSRFLGRDELVKAFVKEAEKDFVGTAVPMTLEERDRAFELLDQMANADGDYSENEHACIDALSRKVRAERAQALAERYSRAARFDREKP